MERKIIGNAILEYIKKYNITHFELDEKLNVSDKIFSRWERGDRLLDLSTIKEISKLLNVLCDELLGIKTNMSVIQLHTADEKTFMSINFITKVDTSNFKYFGNSVNKYNKYLFEDTFSKKNCVSYSNSIKLYFKKELFKTTFFCIQKDN